MNRRLLALALSLPLAGCATKKDVRMLSTEVEAIRASQQQTQQALIQEIRRQTALLMDSVSTKDVRLRGDLLNRIAALDRQLVQIQELTGQSQQTLAVLRQEARQRQEEARAAAAAADTLGGAPEGGASAPAAASADELYSTARDALQRGSLSTARAGFEAFVQSYPRDARAADAQLSIGETYEKGKDREKALAAYQQVLELYPNSSRAPTALLRAAKIEQDRGNRDRSRSMLNQLTTAYPKSPEAADAKKLLGSKR
jgi:tol-pal system protein YbgF